jgi:glutamate N-acetyltransferase / amino-acid N-acetyltransferase
MTDASISVSMLRKASLDAIKGSFNRITVDGDMSPNDSVFVLANGMAGNKKITSRGADYKKMAAALSKICYKLAEDMVYDGEGATKFIKINVRKAKTAAQAEKAARSVANSALVKTMFFGRSMNPGRVISAVGASLEDVKIERVVLKFNGVTVIRGGRMLDAGARKASRELKKRRIETDIDLGAGRFSDFILTTDFSYDYVRINADYS